MPRPNPKTYPFNYLVHADESSKDFENYVSAEAYARETYPTGVHEELWTTDPGSLLGRLPWSEFEDPHKYVWQSPQAVDQFSQLSKLVAANQIDEAKQYLSQLGQDIGEGEFEVADQLAAFVFANIYCSIERRRDAYEAAMEEFEALPHRQDEIE